MASPDDIRIARNLWEHPKWLRLGRAHGPRGQLALIRLWSWVAGIRPKGVLEGFDAEDVEGVLTLGDPTAPALLEDLIAGGWVDRDPETGTLSLHDWELWQSWAFYAPERAERAREAARKRAQNRAKKRRKRAPKKRATRATAEASANSQPAAENPSAPTPTPAPTPAPPPKEGGVGHRDGSDAPGSQSGPASDADPGGGETRATLEAAGWSMAEVVNLLGSLVSAGRAQVPSLPEAEATTNRGERLRVLGACPWVSAVSGVLTAAAEAGNVPPPRTFSQLLECHGFGSIDSPSELYQILTDGLRYAV